MKNKTSKTKAAVAILLAVTVICAGFAACKTKQTKSGANEEYVAVEVTDKNGVPVTDESGEVVTELVPVTTDENGSKTASKAQDGDEDTTGGAEDTTKKKKKKKDKDESTTGSGDTDDTTAAPIVKPDAPAAPTGLVASDIGIKYITLSWNSQDCDGYWVEIRNNDSDDNSWNTVSKTVTKTGIIVKKLTSFTNYSFRVRAFNENEAGHSTSDWVTLDVQTKPTVKPRRIRISVMLPMDSNNDEKLEIYINDELIKEKDVKLDKSTFTFRTKKKYKGVVDITAKLVDKDEERTVTTDKAKVTIDISSIGIDQYYDYEEI